MYIRLFVNSTIIREKKILNLKFQRNNRKQKQSNKLSFVKVEKISTEEFDETNLYKKRKNVSKSVRKAEKTLNQQRNYGMILFTHKKRTRSVHLLTKRRNSSKTCSISLFFVSGTNFHVNNKKMVKKNVKIKNENIFNTL